MGDWDEPDRDQLKEAIVDCYRRRSEVRQKALEVSPQAGWFNWDTSAKQLLDAVKPTSVQVSGRFEHLEPTCQVVVNRRVQAQIGKHWVDLQPGVPHNVVLNVRDVLRRSGYLADEKAILG